MSDESKPIRCVAQRVDGEVDITEGVQALYDLVIQSMDWGSGFLTVEDVEPVVALADACEFNGSEEAHTYLADEKHRMEKEAFYTANPVAARTHAYGQDPGHEHVYSEAKGVCMWWNCRAKREEVSG